MEIATTFTILLPADEAYRFLLDLEQVAPCVPGAELGPAAPDGTYPANVTVRLGPMRLGYSGSLWISEQDDSGRRAVLRARAHETGAQGSLEASMTMNVSAMARMPLAAATITFMNLPSQTQDCFESACYQR